MKKPVKKTERPIFIVLPIIVCFMGLSYMFFLSLGYDKVKEDVDNYVVQWEQDIAHNIFSKENPVLLKKIFEGLKAYPLSKFELISEKRRVLSWSEDKLPGGDCDPDQKIESLLTFNGLHLGKIKSCISKTKVAKSTFFSPSFLFIILITIFLLFISAFIPLYRYKKSLNAIIGILKNWPPHEDYSDFPENKDKITQEVVGLARKAISTRLNLEDVQSALKTEKEVNRIIYQVAHDIVSPSSELKEAMKGDLTRREVNEVIHSSIQRICEVSQDLLNPNSKNSYRLDQVRSTDISCITKEILRDKRVCYKDIQFKLNIKNDVRALCSPAVFKRILSNLINNSIEATPGCQGSIECSLFQEEGSHSCKIIISDKGRGIPTENMDKVFDEYFTSGKKSGNGLGLYYTNKKVKEWGGDIKLHSRVGEGTTMTITLQSRFLKNKNLSKMIPENQARTRRAL